MEQDALWVVAILNGCLFIDLCRLDGGQCS